MYVCMYNPNPTYIHTYIHACMHTYIHTYINSVKLLTQPVYRFIKLYHMKSFQF